MINVLIVEDDRMASKLLEVFLQDSKDYNVIATVESASMAEFYCITNKIDVILMDVCTALDANGLDAAEKIKENLPTKNQIFAEKTIEIRAVFHISTVLPCSRKIFY